MGSTVVASCAPELEAEVLAAWAQGAATATEPWCASFPFDIVADHWHAVGRGRVNPAAVAAVDRCAEALGLDHASGRPPSWTWFLRSWLPMLVDIGHGRCTYATYVGTPALTQWADSEAVVALLLAHLLRHECDAVMQVAPDTVGPRQFAVQVSRIVAVADALMRHRGPYAADDAARLWNAFHTRRGIRRRNRVVVEGASRLADAVIDAAPAHLARQVGLLALPMTTVHEEHLFLRVLQLFETVFSAMVVDIEAARARLLAHDADSAAAALDAASTRLGRAIPFFRIVGTMQPEAFALIREETPGASGLQSTSFKSIELACARQAPERLASPGYGEPVVAALVEAERDRPTIEEHALRLYGGGDAVGVGVADRLVPAMRSLEHRWAQWKKAHWATASRLIGTVPGTGGTAGAAYLRAHMDGRLFPTFWSGNGAR